MNRLRFKAVHEARPFATVQSEVYTRVQVGIIEAAKTASRRTRACHDLQAAMSLAEHYVGAVVV